MSTLDALWKDTAAVFLLQTLHKSHSLLKWGLRTVNLDMLSVQQLNFSFSSLSPLHFIAGLAVCFCVWMQACVSWRLTGYLLFATFVGR